MSNSCSLMVVISFLLLVGCDNISSSPPNATTLCSPEQSHALLHFKHSFSIINTFPDYYEDYYKDACGSKNVSKTESWKEGSDCCRWDGVTCDYLTGDVVALDLSCGLLNGTFYPNSTLFSLHHLRKLNLAWNYFNHSEIPSAFCGFTKLTHLNLSSSYFSGPVPSEISYLSNLLSLDISSSLRLEFSPYSFDRLCLNLTKLKVLSLDGVNMFSIPPSSLLNLSSSSLTSLHLRCTGLHGKFPKDVLHFPLLEQLDLSLNGLFTGSLPNSNWSSSLTYLNLFNCGLILPSVPPPISNLSGLTYLVLGQTDSPNHLSSYRSNSKFPTWIFNLTQLSSLAFVSMQFDGQLPSQLCHLMHLTELDLDNNFFIGKIPSCLFGMPSLQGLYLGNNRLAGITDNFHKYSPLQQLNLRANNFSGSIPNFISKLVNLVYLDLSSNQLNGSMNNNLFSELTNLSRLYLNSNKLGGSVDPSMFVRLKTAIFSNNRNLSLSLHTDSNLSMPNLARFGFSSCNLTEFPIFLKKCSNLSSLDLSDNMISGHLTNEDLNSWPSLSYLNLSHNRFIEVAESPSQELFILNLSSNLLQGAIAVPLYAPPLRFFSVSHNNLSGKIPPKICNMSSLGYLILTNNSLNGAIPSCLINFEDLQVLDLSKNNFQGSIPPLFTNSSYLETIKLNGNQLEGLLPTSLANCSSLEVLDVGNNMLNDTFPPWLATLPELQVLILRSNRFHGFIGTFETRSPFSKLRILDISQNGFTGILPPKLFESFRNMRSDPDKKVEEGDGKSTTAGEYMGSDYYQDSVVLSWKGYELQFDRIFKLLTAIDLSSNRFTGEIPEVVGELNLLKVLNVSHNHLRGEIPVSFTKLREVETLDLSSNSLTGKVPMELTILTFLSTFNVSYNKLEGPIPLGNQFSNFEKDSYIENSGLCGPPLSKKCFEGKEAEPVHLHEEDEEDDTRRWFWKMVKMGYASGVVIGLSIGYMVFSTGKPRWFVKRFQKNRSKYVRRNR